MIIPPPYVYDITLITIITLISLRTLITLLTLIGAQGNIEYDFYFWDEPENWPLSFKDASTPILHTHGITLITLINPNNPDLRDYNIYIYIYIERET